LNNNKILEREIGNRTKHLAKLLEEKDILLKELFHRTKNNMQIISSLNNLQMNSTDNQEVHSVLKKANARLYAMSTVHEKLYVSKDLRFIQLQDYITELSDEVLNSYALFPHRVNLITEIMDILVPLEISIPLGLVITELLINAFKYADVGQEILQIKIKCHYLNYEKIVLSVTDNGTGINPAGGILSNLGLGLTLVKSIVKDQLDGSVQFINELSEFVVRTEIPYNESRPIVFSTSCT